jgi:hypothetical protein
MSICMWGRAGNSVALDRTSLSLKPGVGDPDPANALANTIQIDRRVKTAKIVWCMQTDTT